MYSKKNEGSTFVILIPMESVITNDRLKRSKTLLPRITISNPHTTTMVVDDDKYNRDLNKQFLQKAGVSIEDEAANGEKAVEIFKSRPMYFYDFIVMDLEMPVMNGK